MIFDVGTVTFFRPIVARLLALVAVGTPSSGSGKNYAPTTWRPWGELRALVFSYTCIQYVYSICLTMQTLTNCLCFAGFYIFTVSI